MSLSNFCCTLLKVLFTELFWCHLPSMWKMSPLGLGRGGGDGADACEVPLPPSLPGSLSAYQLSRSHQKCSSGHVRSSETCFVS